MANETTLITRYEFPISMTCANTLAIEKGAWVKLSGSGTVATHGSALDDMAGIAAAEKIASNGQTSIAVYRRGRFKSYLSGTATVGDPLTMDASINFVKSAKGLAGTALSGVKIVGTALESGTTGQTILVELGLEAFPLS